jgi:hypothetical protein
LKRTYLAYLIGAGFLALTCSHLQHTFSRFDDGWLAWCLAVSLELGIAVASFYSFDRHLAKWARITAGCWLGGMIVASYSLNAYYYLPKADAWGFALGLIFPASIAVLGAIEPALREADHRASTVKRQVEAQESVNLVTSASTGRKPVSVKRQAVSVKRSVKVVQPDAPSLGADQRQVDTSHMLEASAPSVNLTASTGAAPDTFEGKSVNQGASEQAAPVELDASGVNLEASSGDWKAQARLLAGTGMSKADIARSIGKSRQVVSGYLNSLPPTGDEEGAAADAASVNSTEQQGGLHLVSVNGQEVA